MSDLVNFLNDFNPRKIQSFDHGKFNVALQKTCKTFLPREHIKGTGRDFWGEIKEIGLTTPENLPVIIPTSLDSNFNKLIRWSILYSDTTVFALPFNIDFTFNNLQHDYNLFRKLENYAIAIHNFLPLIKKNLCHFTPLRYSHTSNYRWHEESHFSKVVYKAPSIEEKKDIENDISRISYKFLEQIRLPFLEGIEIDDLLEIKEKYSFELKEFKKLLQVKFVEYKTDENSQVVDTLNKEIKEGVEEMGAIFSNSKKTRGNNIVNLAYLVLNIASYYYEDISGLSALVGKMTGKKVLDEYRKDLKLKNMQKNKYLIPYLIQEKVLSNIDTFSIIP